MGGIVSQPSASASSPLLTSTTSAATATSLNCPSVPLTTVTISTTTYVPSYTDTYTYYATSYDKTVTLTSPVNYQFYSAVPIYTQTVTVTTTPVTVVSQVPFTSTVTVPTPDGFTPVLCEATYQYPSAPTVTLTSSTTTGADYHLTITSSRSGTTTTTLYPITGTVTIPYFAEAPSIVRYTPTSTATRTNPVQTIYDACNNANVVSRGPRGGDFVGTYIKTNLTVEAGVPAIDQTDCCAVCQANSTCLASAYNAIYYPYCRLYIFDPTATQCDPTQVGAFWYETPNADYTIFVSNSGCGEISGRTQFY